MTAPLVERLREAKSLFKLPRKVMLRDFVRLRITAGQCIDLVSTLEEAATALERFDAGYKNVKPSGDRVHPLFDDFEPD